MKLSDLHCDTLWKWYKDRGLNRYKNSLHIDLERGQRFAPWLQCFAAWMPDQHRGEKAKAVFEGMNAVLKETLKENGEAMRLILSGEDLKKAAQEKKSAVIFAVEGGAAAGGSLEGLRQLYQEGVRMMTLTWNGANEIGGGAAEPGELTAFGVSLVKEMEKLGMIIDLSHASDALFWSVAENAQKPFVATHSNARKICSHRRNLTDDEFLEICRRGGLVGLNFTTEFLREESGKAVSEDILRHAEHFLSLGGENIIALGSDFDGTTVPKEITGIESMEMLAEMFLRHNYPETLVSKIFFENSYKFFLSL